MAATDPHEQPGVELAGAELHDLIRELFPIPRSITGNGLRRTLELIGERVPLEVTEVPSGTPVLDWTVPQEWNIEAAWIEGPDGRRVVDYADSPLHVLAYSVPVRERLSLDELEQHLFSLPEHPDWIPFRNSYYHPNWGFCLQHRLRESLPDGEYEVCIDSTLEDGSLTYAEAFVPGESDDEVLVSGYADHPAMANDNLSGLALMALLARELAGRRAPLLLPLPLQPRDDRADRLARPQRGRGSRASSTGSSASASATRARSPTRRAVAGPRRSTVRRSSCSATRASRSRCTSGSPGAVTSASSTHRASTSRSGRSRARRPAASPSTTPPPTTSTSSGPRRSRAASRPTWTSSTCSRRTPPT